MGTAPPEERSLVAEILANLSSVEPLAEYTDWLGQHGVPLAEEVHRWAEGREPLTKWLDALSECRLFACDCADRVLPLFKAAWPDHDDAHLRKCIVIARKYAHKQATKEDLVLTHDASIEAEYHDTRIELPRSLKGNHYAWGYGRDPIYARDVVRAARSVALNEKKHSFVESATRHARDAVFSRAWSLAQQRMPTSAAWEVARKTSFRERRWQGTRALLYIRGWADQVPVGSPEVN